MPNPRVASRAVLLVVSILVLLGSVGPSEASAYYSLTKDSQATISTPEVILQNGTAGTSTIYTNNTSAKVTVEALNWLGGWDKRVKITVNSSDLDEELTDFPLLVYLSNSSSGENGEDVSFIFDEVGSNRKKMAVTVGDGTSQCYVEIERWDDASEQAWLWVKVPSINNVSDTELYLYYDMDHVDNINYVGDPNSTAAEKVWDSSFKAVHHMKEDPSGNITDSTNNQNDMNSVGGMSSSNLVDANIGKGVSFDGGDDAYIGQGSITLTQFVFSGWINGSSFSSWRAIVAVGEQRDLCLNTGVLTLWVDDNEYSFGSSLTTGAWYHVAVTYDGTTLKGYINGSDTGNSYTPALSSYAETMQIARWLADLDYFNGVLDEIRISNQSRSAAWLKASYESGRDDLLDFQLEERNVVDYVDNNTSDVDSSADKGTHSNFESEKAVDGMDTLTEADQGSAGTPESWTSPTSFSDPSSHWTSETNAYDENTGTQGDCAYSSGSGAWQGYLELHLDSSVTSSKCRWWITTGPKFSDWEVSVRDDPGWTVVLTTSSPTTGAWVNTTYTTQSVDTIRVRFRYSSGAGSGTNRLFEIDVLEDSVAGVSNYELDLEIQWTNANYTRTNEELCIKTGTTDTEDIEVYVWNVTGSSWHKVSDDLAANTWNNISVSTYLTDSNFTVRFKGANETGDAAQDSWNIDAALLHVWTAEMNFDYVLRANNTDTDSFQIRMKQYSDSNINRLQNCTIYFHNSTDGTLWQIYIEDGAYTQSTGPWYDIAASQTIYIAMTAATNSTGISSIYTYLEVLIPNTSTYAQYIITFEIS